MDASVTSGLLTDSTKYGAVSRFHVVDLERLDLVISDDELPRETGHRVEESGIELVTASMLGRLARRRSESGGQVLEVGLDPRHRGRGCRVLGVAPAVRGAEEHPRRVQRGRQVVAGLEPAGVAVPVE